MKTKIIIASTLKPLDDPRSYEKFALSLAGSGKYNVHLLGPTSNHPQENKEIIFHDLPSVKRNSLKRLFLPLKIWSILIKVKPQLIIANTHDLLWVVALYRIFFGCRVIYDIQENYYRNLRYQHNYSWLLKQLLAIYVRLKEYIASPFIHGFTLAERCYQQELHFIGKRVVVLENKYYPIVAGDPGKKSLHGKVKFICTGTIAAEYGVFEAIKWFTEIEPMLAGSELIIVGHCPNQRTYDLVIEQTKQFAAININLSKTPVPHKTLMKAMTKADVLLLPYRPNRSTALCVPTKLFEALALKMPVIISDNKLWSAIIQDSHAGLLLNFMEEETDYSGVAEKLANNSFYDKKGHIDPFWSIEEPKLLEFVAQILKN